ncbi:hypothetical protein PV10_07868 [Exophiala mesophila]|uniref:Uncharacterized protein n=1 Tax=Exophiala mesophila TaxID=212818 RepID=A0A0D1Z6Z4_EXOME|nr:uncharacterized protein PV10_07868 [Exophiala mesophila]KIV90582.1 hypothetical protein PV10_07868 [Exophiala mesophila]
MKVSKVSAGTTNNGVASNSIPQQPTSFISCTKLSSVSDDSLSTPTSTSATSDPATLTNQATPSGLIPTRFYSESKLVVDSDGPKLLSPELAPTPTGPRETSTQTQQAHALETSIPPPKASVIVCNKRPQGVSPGGFGRHTNDWLRINVNLTATSSNLARLVVDTVAEEVKKLRKENSEGGGQ